MGEPIKISEAELQEFSNLKDKIQQNIFEFGKLYMEKMELDGLYKALGDKESTLRKETDEFKKLEIDLMNRILNKYGEGNLDIKNGIFRPS